MQVAAAAAATPELGAFFEIKDDLSRGHVYALRLDEPDGAWSVAAGTGKRGHTEGHAAKARFRRPFACLTSALPLCLFGNLFCWHLSRERAEQTISTL